MKTTIGMTAEAMTEILDKSLSEWGCKLKYACNWDATNNGQQIAEIIHGDNYSRLHQKGKYFFIEVRQKGDMYPRVYNVSEPTYNICPITEDEYNIWLEKQENGHYNYLQNSNQLKSFDIV